MDSGVTSVKDDVDSDMTLESDEEMESEESDDEETYDLEFADKADKNINDNEENCRVDYHDMPTFSKQRLQKENDVKYQIQKDATCKSYTIEYEWEVENIDNISGDSNNKSNSPSEQGITVDESHPTEMENRQERCERRRRKREKKDITKIPSQDDTLTSKSDVQPINDSEGDDQQGKQKRKSRGRRVYSCDLCSRVFSKSSHLIRHIRVHTGEKPFSCGVCGDNFSLNSILKSHMLIHTQEKPYPCDLCDLKFSRSGDLKSHRRVHTGEKPYQCLFCGRFFRQSGVLKKHERIHTGEKPYTCTICGRSFRQNGDAQKHIRTHTGEKPFECHVCGKEFARNNDMLTHVRRHTGEKPYSCGICSKSFVDNCGLRRHIKIHSKTINYSHTSDTKTPGKKPKTEILVQSSPMLISAFEYDLLPKLQPEIFTKTKSKVISGQAVEPFPEYVQNTSSLRLASILLPGSSSSLSSRHTSVGPEFQQTSVSSSIDSNCQQSPTSSHLIVDSVYKHQSVSLRLEELVDSESSVLQPPIGFRLGEPSTTRSSFFDESRTDPLQESIPKESYSELFPDPLPVMLSSAKQFLEPSSPQLTKTLPVFPNHDNNLYSQPKSAVFPEDNFLCD